jgi:DNA primase
LDLDLKQTRRVLYRLPELIEAASAEQCIFVVEGEKDSDSLRKLNIPATTCPGGANKWLPEYSDCLRGCHVVLIPDNDDTGRAHMDKVAASLRGIADSIRILRLPGLPSAGDVSDWLADGGSAEALWQIVDATAQWAPSEVDRWRIDPSRPNLAARADAGVGHYRHSASTIDSTFRRL